MPLFFHSWNVRVGILFLAIIFVVVFAYQSERNSAKERAVLINSLDGKLADIDVAIRDITPLFEQHLDNLSAGCARNSTCSVTDAVKYSVIYYDSKAAVSSFKSEKILLGWYKEKLDGLAPDTHCSSLSGNALTLSTTLALSESMRGASDLIKKQSDFDWPVLTGFNTSGLQNNSQSLEYIRSNISAEKEKLLAAHVEEVRQNYTLQKGYSKQALAESLNAPGAGSWAINRIESYACGFNVNSAAEVYHSEFIEYSYNQLESLSDSGRYEEALPFANIIDGYLD